MPRRILPTAPTLVAALAGVAALVGAAAPVSSQSVPSSFRYVEHGKTVSVFVADFGSEVGRFGFGPRSGTLLGARWGVETGGPLAVEFVGSYFPTTRAVVDPRQAGGPGVVGEADVDIASVDVRARFSLIGRRTWNGLRPHVLAGIGLGFDLASEQEQDERVAVVDRYEFGTAFLGVFGGGIGWSLGERIELRGDAYVTLWKLDTPDGFLDQVEGDVPEGEWVNNGALSIGLSYRY